MRVGITTFYQSNDNYGQLLQGYALQAVLLGLGHKPFTIRYGFHQRYPQLRRKERRRIFWRERLEALFPFMERRQPDSNGEYRATEGRKGDRGFDEFRERHLRFSVLTYNSLRDVRRYPPVAGCYVTGSDQVWAQLLTYEDHQIFFLDFGSRRTMRISYAPSFALEKYPADLMPKLSEQLSHFDAISVREQEGVEICREAGFDAELVLDPTLLLTKEQYEPLMRESAAKMPSGFSFVYQVNVASPEELLWDSFRSYNQARGYNTIAVHANGTSDAEMEFLDGAEYAYPNIQEWLCYISSSEYVLTSSFHGMAFAIIFHKPFAVCLRKSSMFAGNGRILTLLKALGLESRIAAVDKDVAQVLEAEIDWQAVDARLEKLRANSLDYLVGALAGKTKNNKVTGK